MCDKFSGVHQDNIFLRMSKDDKALAMEEVGGIGHFEPMEGRIMKEYISIPKEVAAEGKLVKILLDKSYDYASSLPPKVKKRKG